MRTGHLRAELFHHPLGYAFVTNVVGSTAIFLGFLKWELGVRPAVNRISASAFDLCFVHSDFNTSHLLFSGLLDRFEPINRKIETTTESR